MDGENLKLDALITAGITAVVSLRLIRPSPGAPQH
jgi:hypothetical protein